MTDYDDDDDHLLPEWRAWITRFPDVGTALAAARRGEEVSLNLLADGLQTLTTVIPADDGPGGIVEDIYYLGAWDALKGAVMNARAHEPAQIPAILAAAISWIQAEIARIGIAPGASLQAFAVTDGDEDGSDCPTLAVRGRRAVSGTESWESLDEQAYNELSGLNAAAEFADAPASLLRALTSAGAHVVVCAECGEYLTNTAPDFPGVWFTLHESPEAICGLGAWPPQAHAPGLWQGARLGNLPGGGQVGVIMTDSLVARYVRDALERNAAWDKAIDAAERQKEAEGYRLVSGDGDESGRWAIIDYRTSAVLAEGFDGRGGDDHAAAVARLEAAGKPLWDTDDIYYQTVLPGRLKPPPGLTQGLCDAIWDWVADTDGRAEAAEWLEDLADADAARKARASIEAGEPSMTAAPGKASP